MIIDLTTHEQMYLVELLAKAQKEMLHELNHTDTREYKEILKRRLETLEGLRAKIPAEAPPASS